MGRAPCCEKMGLKKGPWTPEEDLILINYIQKFGHGNWRALPKHAGLLRCGKSCRLRWINYLRPDIKRGNFTHEEEETIIHLHELLGNRWSAIAARLPGRTDNEIKNVWHTHLKKKLLKKNHATVQELKSHPADDGISRTNNKEMKMETETETKSISQEESDGMNKYRPNSPQQCSSDESTLTTGDKIEFSNDFPEMDESFWSEVLSSDESRPKNDTEFQVPLCSATDSVQFGCNSSLFDGMDFWYNLFTGAGESLELPELFG